MIVEELIKELQKYDSRAPVHWDCVLDKSDPDSDIIYRFEKVEIFEDSSTCMAYSPEPGFEGVETAWLQILLKE